MSCVSKRLEMHFQSCYMVLNTFKQSLKMFIHPVYLSVCLSVCVRFNCSMYALTMYAVCVRFNYSSNVPKLTHAIHTWYGMDSIENDIYGTKCSFTEKHRIFLCISVYQGEAKFVKFIATYLYCTKYNKIKYFIQLCKSMFRIQDHTNVFWYIVSYNLKRLHKHFKLCFMVCFHHTKF